MALFNEKELEQQEIVKKEKPRVEKKAFRFNERELEQQPLSKPKEIVKVVEEEKKVEKKSKVKAKQKEKKNDKSTGFFSRKKKEVPPKVKKSIAEIMQVVDMTEDGIFELKNGEFLEVLQVEGEDMYSKNNEEQAFVIFSHAYFYQAYKHAIKLIFLNFPCQTTEQQKYINKKIRECDNPLYERILVQKLKELKFLEWGRTNREALLFIYGDSELIVKERVDAAKRYIKRSTELLDIDEDKKLEVLFKLFNQNAKLGTKNI
ncbi:hypothetical protein [Bacillus pseudomycoides]|uniref:hypothetical protein n=1 Tax=Bacillus pseudomycoides TaxID=64104 RepID=UPI000BEE6146|nr:hypothetical protein [Bacillus pseudomycoides]MED4654514.1 hypothetical protein [Bacillus pseudomycoides]PDZ11199.1 hypothetical protein CON70_12840 [Bacillus pseudomycoides]PEE03539.1 hypothetical protein CON86_24800 [Bacillus pseudomycoides]PEI89823.1 hypothetical protein CN679_19515 [Bacillus pseudomycoides]PEM72033.1 hypothetical protein CN632_23165 [Bacillus pseudomycoides]